MKSINKQDFSNMINYAINEYGSNTLRKKELMENGGFVQEFDSLVANVEMIAVDKSRLYVRRYEIFDNSGDKVINFILGHAAVLFGLSMKHFRQQLLETEGVRGIITLKQSVFKELKIPAVIIILGKNTENTWLTTAENIDVLIDMFEEKFPENAKVYYTNELSADNMTPEHYNGDNQIIEDSFKGKETRKLANIAEVILGKGAKRDDYSKSGIPYLRARDIQNGEIVSPDVYIGSGIIEQFSKQLVQPGDILLTKNFGQHKLALVTENNVPAVASNMLFIIRPFGVSEGYLYSYLTSKTGNEIFNKQLNHIQRGTIYSHNQKVDSKQ